MKTPLAHSAFVMAVGVSAAFFATNALSEDVAEAAPSSAGNVPTTIYRQVMPDGRVIYTDKAIKEGKVDHTITVAPPIKGNLWTTEPGPRPHIPPQVVPTQIIRAPALSPEEKKRVLNQADANVIRAEMLLEDAKRKQEDGVEPLPGERTGNADGTSRLNETYDTRQKLLARAVAYAEAELKRAKAQQDALR